MNWGVQPPTPDNSNPGQHADKDTTIAQCLTLDCTKSMIVCLSQYMRVRVWFVILSAHLTTIACQKRRDAVWRAKTLKRDCTLIARQQRQCTTSATLGRVRVCYTAMQGFSHADGPWRPLSNSPHPAVIQLIGSIAAAHLPPGCTGQTKESYMGRHTRQANKVE